MTRGEKQQWETLVTLRRSSSGSLESVQLNFTVLARIFRGLIAVRGGYDPTPYMMGEEEEEST